MPAVGGLCPFIRFGAGSVSTQAWANPALGPDILERLENDESAENALAIVMAAEVDAELHQVGVVDTKGGSAAFTGTIMDGWSGHRCGPNYSVQGNMLTSEGTIIAMEKVFTAASPELTIGERLLMALEAGQAAGGDSRGRQSAALLVRGPEVYPLADLRADEHSDPLVELRRIYEIARVELFPFIASLPTKENTGGNFAAVRANMAPKT